MVKTNILEVVVFIAEQCEDSKLEKATIKKLDKKCECFANYLNITKSQALLLASVFAMNYKNGEVNYNDMARYFDCNPLKILHYKNDMDKLVGLKLLEKSRSRHGSEMTYLNESFAVSSELAEAITCNVPFELNTSSKEITPFDFLEMAHNQVDKRDDEHCSTRELFDFVKDLLEHYKDLEFVRKIKILKLNDSDLTAFLYLCGEVVDCGKNSEDLDRMAGKIFAKNRSKYQYMKDVINGQTDLTRKNIVKLDDNQFKGDTDLVLTDSILDMVFEEHAIFFKQAVVEKSHLLKAADIATKKMFYHKNDEQQIGTLSDTLAKRNFKALQKRLSDKKLPVGVNVLFYGTPGTGKTETALQLARITGRDVMQVDISNSKSMWFGESEKIIKRIFTQYRDACKTAKNVPILLFNEADAILGKRKSSTASNVAQTENAMQNILLEEMEKMQGILIATTNLNDNLDSAFDRRFLYKIEFHKPDEQAMAKIWKAKLSGYKKHEYEVLAENFNLSGGQIENVVRKVTMQEVLYNNKPDLHTLSEYCIQEGEYRNEKTKKVGF